MSFLPAVIREGVARVSSLRLLIVRIVLLLVGSIYVASALGGAVGDIWISALALLFGVAQVAIGISLRRGRPTVYGAAVLVVAAAVVVDAFTARLFGFVLYAVLLAVLLLHRQEPEASRGDSTRVPPR
jgi:hypothetical protein